METTRFTGNFTQQEPIPEEGIARAVEVMRSGRLHRYNVAPGETSETVLLERDFAAYLGARHVLACASGGYALHVALRAWGLEPGAPVLTNAFTLSPVPGAIHAAGGKPVLVETTRDLVIDLVDLEAKISASGARVLLLSHMRGHLVDMEALTALLDRHGVALIEDCAHTMGAAWAGKASGTWGVAACFSTQTYKHVNSGEGGFLTTDDDALMARAIVHSGSYMLFDRHETGPGPEAYADAALETPNMSGRMDNLRAAILRPQLAGLAGNVARWNARYQAVEAELQGVNGVYLPLRPAVENYVGSSFQFLVEGISAANAQSLLETCLARGVELKWFGTEGPHGYTSRHSHWRYVEPQELPASDHILAGLFDMRIPLTFSEDDCRLIGRILRECLSDI